MARIQHESPDDLMTAGDAARILGLSADMVRVLARNGRLVAAVRSVSGVRMFRRADIEELAEMRRQKATVSQTTAARARLPRGRKG
jgi:DNA-binding transcriptional MerR regulator